MPPDEKKEKSAKGRKGPGRQKEGETRGNDPSLINRTRERKEGEGEGQGGKREAGGGVTEKGGRPGRRRAKKKNGAW